jgi:hypothetical protein
VVWEYISPLTKDGIKQVITDQYPMYNSVFRCARYAADHPALYGKPLTKDKTITSKTPQYFTPAGLITAAGTSELEMPKDLALQQNYPNPFNPATVIKYELSVPRSVTLIVYDMLGREVAVLVNGEKPAGTYSVTWNAANLTSGVYFYKLTAGNFTQTKQMLLLK